MDGRDERSRGRTREPLKCLSNSVDSQHVGFVDIQTKDGTVVIADAARGGHVSNKPVKPGPHQSGVARIFLCPGEEFLDELEDYLEHGEDGPPNDTQERAKRKRYNAGDQSEHCPYVLHELLRWTCRKSKPERPRHDEKEEELARESQHRWQPKFLDKHDAIYTFTELLFSYGTNVELVQHQIYLFHDDADKMTIVWRCCEKFWHKSIYQQAFLENTLAGKRYFGLFRHMRPSHDTFLVLFLLQVLSLDADELERAVKREMGLKLFTDLKKTADSIPTNYFEAMEWRISNFKLIKCVVGKAEDVNEVWAYLCQRLDFSSNKNQSEYLHDQIDIGTHRCASLVKHSKRLDARYQDLFALNTTVSQSRQSSSVAILTVLAAVFLPLSLASAVLSMQYRFSDLGLRFYDFVGVSMIFYTFALVCFVIVRHGSHLVDKFWSLKHLKRDQYNNNWRTDIKGITYSYIVGWTLVLISFLMGMFLGHQNVDWRAYPVLASGIAIFITAPFVVPVVHILGAFCGLWPSWKLFSSLP